MIQCAMSNVIPAVGVISCGVILSVLAIVMHAIFPTLHHLLSNLRVCCPATATHIESSLFVVYSFIIEKKARLSY